MATIDILIYKKDLAKQLKKIMNSKDHLQPTLLHKASSKGNLKMVKDLILSGAEIEARGSFEETSLHIASFRGRTDVVKFLINMGAQIEAKSKFGGTPLHLSGNHEITKILISHKSHQLFHEHLFYSI